MKHNKIALLLLLFITGTLLSCGQKPYGEAPLMLDRLSFGLNIKDIYPDKYLDQSDSGNEQDSLKSRSYNIPVKGDKEDKIWIEKAYEYDAEDIYDSLPAIRWVEYRSRSARSSIVPAMYGKYAFSWLNIATSRSGELWVAGASEDDMSDKNTNGLKKSLHEKYGEPVHSEQDFFGGYDTYTWTLDDRLIKLVVSQKSHGAASNTLTIRSGEQNTISKKKMEEAPEAPETSPEAAYMVHLFVIKKEIAKDLAGRFTTGNLLFCK